MLNILITGGSSSLGREVIKKIHSKKVNIFCQIYKAKPFFKKKNIQFFNSNFSNQNSLKKFINIILKKKKKIDFILHFPSSKIKIKKFEEYEWSEINNQINIQVRSLHFLLSNLIKKKLISENPIIIIVGSKVTEGIPPRGMLDYASAKGLLKFYADILQVEFKKMKLYFLTPDMFESPLLSNLPKYFIEKNTTNNLYKNKIVKKIVSIFNYKIENN